jgi:DNA-binding response OmpR family regulator
MNTAWPQPAAAETSHVLIVDGDAQAGELLAMLLRLSDPAITTVCAQTAQGAARLASELRPQVAIIDLGTEAASGTAIAGDVLAGCSGARPVMIGLAAVPHAIEEAGFDWLFDHVLAKPLELPSLVGLVTQRRATTHSH